MNEALVVKLEPKAKKENYILYFLELEPVLVHYAQYELSISMATKE